MLCRSVVFLALCGKNFASKMASHLDCRKTFAIDTAISTAFKITKLHEKLIFMDCKQHMKIETIKRTRKENCGPQWELFVPLARLFPSWTLFWADRSTQDLWNSDDLFQNKLFLRQSIYIFWGPHYWSLRFFIWENFPEQLSCYCCKNVAKFSKMTLQTNRCGNLKELMRCAVEESE